MEISTKLLSAAVVAGLIPFTAQANDDFAISTKGGLSVKKTDGTAGFSLNGRVQWDYDSTNSASRDEETFEVRRARLTLKGYMGNWGYKATVNFNETGGDDAADIYVAYTGFGKRAKITVGRTRLPFGLENNTSSNYLSIIERSAASEAYVPNRNSGVQVSGVSGNQFTYAAGIFRDDSDVAPDSVAERSFIGRMTFAPINTADTVIHFGAAAKFGDQEDVFGLEAAAVLGAFHAQAEYKSQDTDDSDTVDISYLQLGYFFTGEVRPYKAGTFKGVKPKKGTAIEAAIRYEEGYGRYSDVGLSTDEGSQLALGLNFYPNSQTRLSLSYMDASTDSDNLDGDELRLRAQFIY